RGRWSLILVVSWALVCAVALRVPYRHMIGALGIAHERGLHAFHIRPHPVTTDDYAIAHTFYEGRAPRRLAPGDRSRLLGDQIAPDHPPPVEARLISTAVSPIVAVRRTVGVLGYAAGPRVHVVDRLGLGDAIAARLRVERRGRPGHEKWLPDEWVAGR